ncbi:MAG: DNA internalization-related competence protein ComEC/Rec2 [Lachnospiraceae bacterium]|nr:DNA internalization-related competence protein ComEC/Rec2 [Lachnospiraceae bacterium]
MSSSERVRRPRLRRPLVFLACLWIFFLLLQTLRGLPLRLPAEAEKAVAAAEAAETGAEAVSAQKGLAGTLCGRIREIEVTASGSYSLILSGADFFPEGTKDSLSAGTVLAYFPQNCVLRPGYTVCLQGKLCIFEEARNPGAFDPSAYYLSLGIACQMQAEALRIEEEHVFPIREAARQVRSYLAQGLRMVYPSGEAALLSAMLLGDRSGLDAETQAQYETAGLSHLLSVSGLHVSFWALLIGRGFGFLLSFFPFSRGKNRLSRIGFSCFRGILAAAAVFFYMILSGGRVPVRRAGLMALLYHLSQALPGSYDLPSALSLAALSILIPYPYALFQASFQLSFGCVLILGCLLPLLIEKLHCEALLSRSLLVPVTLQMGTLPLTLYHSFCFHPYSVPANLLVLPFFGLILAGGSLSSLLIRFCRPAGMIIGGGVRLLLEGVRWLCRAIEAAPLHTVVLGRPALWQILIYLLLAAAGPLLAFRIRRRETEADRLSLEAFPGQTAGKMLREVKRTALLIFFWLLGAASVFLLRRPGELTITSFYVGQGDSHLLQLPDGHSYLLDGGSSYSETEGTDTILPALRFYGIRRLEYVMVSHCDADHMNGLDEVLAEPSLTIGGLILPSAYRGSVRSASLIRAAGDRNIPVLFLGEGWAWQDGDCFFEVLYPADEAERDPDNESSLVLKLTRQNFSALFTGDLGFAGEEYLLNRQPDAIRNLSWLKVAHHGSRYSSAAAFLKLASPRIAFISCGRGNRYGHPAQETLNRLKETGTLVLRTDRDGALELSVSDSGEMKISQYIKENHYMNQKEEEKITKSTWISCGIMIGIGILALCLSLWGPKKTPAETSPAAAESTEAGQTESRRETEKQTASYLPKTTEETESWPAVLPTGRDPLPIEALPSRDCSANGGRETDGEDPQAPGFVFSPELTDYLYTLFASELTNNTREEDPFRSIGTSLKTELDRMGVRFVEGSLKADEIEEKMQGLSFVWPQDPLRLIHQIGTVSARVYAYGGQDMELAKDRIVMTNQAGRHYLFLRVYVSETENAVRIYMINALIY